MHTAFVKISQYAHGMGYGGNLRVFGGVLPARPEIEA